MLPHKILLVEDDPDMRLLFRLILQNAGYAVKEAADGLQAIGMLQVEEFDAVMLDICMPRIDGCSALDTFKMMRHGQCTPVITITALDDPTLESRVYESGAFAFLRKPVAPSMMIETVRNAIAERGAPVAV
ncbi:MAG: response regulator [Armatimonadota bacterium]|nr:response regulator [Armatimonadota bacterium]